MRVITILIASLIVTLLVGIIYLMVCFISWSFLIFNMKDIRIIIIVWIFATGIIAHTLEDIGRL